MGIRKIKEGFSGVLIKTAWLSILKKLNSITYTELEKGRPLSYDYCALSTLSVSGEGHGHEERL